MVITPTNYTKLVCGYTAVPVMLLHYLQQLVDKLLNSSCVLSAADPPTAEKTQAGDRRGGLQI